MMKKPWHPIVIWMEKTIILFFEDRMWTILSENTNKYVHAKLREAKDNGDKDPIELLSEGADQNPCA